MVLLLSSRATADQPCMEDAKLVRIEDNKLVPSSLCPNAALLTSAGPGREDNPSFPLITVTINPLEQNEMTFIPGSAVPSPTSAGGASRKLSIGSASSLGT